MKKFHCRSEQFLNYCWQQNYVLAQGNFHVQLCTLQFHMLALFMCNGGHQSTFVGNKALLPSGVIDFAMLPAQRLLTGNSFIVSCHVTSRC